MQQFRSYRLVHCQTTSQVLTKVGSVFQLELSRLKHRETGKERNVRPKGDGRSGPWVPPLPVKKLNILEYLTLKSSSVLLFFLVSHFECEIGCSTYDISQQEWGIFVVMLCHGKLDRSLFCMAGPKGLCYSRHLGRNRRAKELYQF